MVMHGVQGVAIERCMGATEPLLVHGHLRFAAFGLLRSIDGLGVARSRRCFGCSGALSAVLCPWRQRSRVGGGRSHPRIGPSVTEPNADWDYASASIAACCS